MFNSPLQIRARRTGLNFSTTPGRQNVVENVDVGEGMIFGPVKTLGGPWSFGPLTFPSNQLQNARTGP